MAMTPRERVAAALNHREPDCVPIDFGSTHCSGINVLAHNRLKKRLGLSSPTYMRNIILMLAAPDLDRDFEVMREMGADLVTLPRHLIDELPMTGWKPWKLGEGSECLVPGGFNPVKTDDGGWSFATEAVTYRMPKDGDYFDPVGYPLEAVNTVEELEALLPLARESCFFTIKDEELDRIEERAKYLYEQTDYALVSDLYFLSLYQMSHQVFGYEKFFTMMATDPDFVHRWMQLMTEFYDVMLTRYLGRVGKYTQVVLTPDDFGQQNGPQISPRMFRELVKPYLTKLCGRIHELAPHVKVLLHSCGSIYKLIPDIIEAGVDALNPLQTSAREMDPAVLKREFGRDLVLWGGGITAQTTLDRGSIEEIKKEVRERIEILKPGGGFIFSVDHDIQENVSAEKIEAVFKTAQGHRAY